MQKFASFQDGINAQGGRLNLIGQKLVLWLKKVPLIRWQQLIVALLLVWLAHTLAVLFWMLLAAPAIPQAQVSENAIMRDSGASASRSVDITALKNLDMFGASTGEVEVNNVVEEVISTQGPQIEDQAVDTKLKLVLQGVISSSDTKASRAIIAQGKEQEVYGAGDEINKLRGVKVAKVLDLRVILDNKGRYESLWLYSDDPNAPKTQITAVNVPSRTRDDDDDEPEPEYDSPKAEIQDRAIRNGRKDEPDEDDSLEAAGKRLADVVAINIHRVEGKVKGYRLRPGRDAEAFAALGLEAGDIVTSVNGEMLDNPSKIMEIYRSIGQATSASLEIEREGSPMTIDIQLD